MCITFTTQSGLVLNAFCTSLLYLLNIKWTVSFLSQQYRHFLSSCVWLNSTFILLVQERYLKEIQFLSWGFLFSAMSMSLVFLFFLLHYYTLLRVFHTNVRSGRSAEVIRLSKSQRSLYVSFFRTDSGLYIPFVRMVKFKFLVQFPVDHLLHPVILLSLSSLLLFYSFESFSHEP